MQKIKSKIIDYLAKYKQYNKLFQLSKALKSEQKLFSKIQIALIKLLLPIPTEKNSAVKIIKEINFTNVPDKTYFRFVSFCSDFLSNVEIRELFLNRVISKPKLFEDLVDKDGMRFGLRKEIIKLYDDLKTIWIFQPELIRTLKLEISYFSSPAEEIYDSIFILSDLWNKSRTENLKEDEVVSVLTKSIESLHIKREKEFKTRAHGLFDMDTDSTFISDSIKHFYKDIFNLSNRFLSEKNIEKLVNYWISLDKSGNIFRHFSVGLTIASEIYNSKHKNLTELIYKIITHAEEITRLEQDTLTLTSRLGQVAESFGMCGFKEDFNRIYNQLIEISFGVSYRKDYQASDIIEPMELIHQIDPDNTLKRLTEVLHIQNRLNEAGNGRMRHICTSNLIAFSADKYPELAFQLMELEEVNIARAEAIDIIINPLIKNCSNEDLGLYLAIIKTLPRWKNSDTSEGHFIDLAKTLLLRAIYLKNDEFIGKIIEIVKFNITVELEEASELSKFSEILTEKGIDYTTYSLPDPEIVDDDQTINTNSEEQSVQKEKFSISHEKLQFRELIPLFENEYEEFDKYIEYQFNLHVQNIRNQSLRKEYHSAKSLFKTFYNETSPENKLIIDRNKYKIIREYIKLKNKLVHHSDVPLSLRKIEDLFGKCIEEIEDLFSDKVFSTYVNEQLDIEEWFESILHNVNWQKDILFYQILSEKEVLSLVDQCSMMSFDNLLQFIEKWTQHRTRSASLLKVANRLVSIDSTKAKEVVSMASQYDFDSLLFQRNGDPDKLDFDIIETILKVDKEFGKKFLLNSYNAQKGKYSRDLINSLDKLLIYKDYFDDESIKVYYDANLQYNRELALGLPDKVNKYEFIAQHSETHRFSKIVIRHLVWLFNYPAVKIRELALQSAFDLIENNPDYIKSFIHFGIENGNDNEIEYSIVVLQAIALKNSSLLIQFKNELINLLKKEHFNILETTIELLLLINQSKSSFLTMNEISRLQSSNSASSIFSERDGIISNNQTNKFLYSFFQRNLFKEVFENEYDSNSLYDSVYADIISRGWKDYDVEKEGTVHQRYNLNTNFDTIEIQSPYYDEVKSSLNKIFHTKIKKKCFESSFVEDIKTQFRVYDPSKLLYSIVTRPPYINWITEKISKDDFLSFSDLDSLIQKFVHREEDYITLVEDGSQRVNRYKELNGTCYFGIRAFLKNRDYDLAEISPMPFLELKNQYAYEMPLVEHESATFPLKQIVPLIQISYNNYRGEQDLANATLFSDTFTNLGIEEKNILETFNLKRDYSLKAIRWINSYTSSTDRRRYKPTSEGFSIKIKKDFLLDYLMDIPRKVYHHSALKFTSKFLAKVYQLTSLFSTAGTVIKINYTTLFSFS